MYCAQGANKDRPDSADWFVLNYFDKANVKNAGACIAESCFVQALGLTSVTGHNAKVQARSVTVGSSVASNPEQ